MQSRSPIMRLATVLAGIALFGSACTATATVTSTPGADVDTSSVDDTATAGVPATPIAPVAEPTAEAAAVTEATAPQGCTYLGVDDFNDMQIELIFIVDLDRQSDANAQYSVLDRSGNEIANSGAFLEDLAPGEAVRVHVDTFEDGPAGSRAAGITCTFDGLQVFEFDVDPIRPADTDSCRFVELDTFGDIQIELDFINPLPTAGEIAVDFALRGPGGIRFEDGVVFTQGEPGARIVEPFDSFTDFPEWMTEADFSCEILAIESF